ncbi:ATP-binding protein [Klebsiella pneumoniae]|uniref:ATP-binding protein n=1 Tax=Klebsiella pneumoniae TaxID=573 RepID=UPI002AB562EB|nr:ATP-binding protein [Klebsiella pneumoniae]MDY7611931.1 ATP-binding protein [Klebsiella pneumoniae]
MFSVDVSPDMNMYTLLVNQAYDSSFALCEFIDNAIHAHLISKKMSPLNINLDFYSNENLESNMRNKIVIRDNGPGINRTLLEKALKPASKPVTKGLSEFGIGMKAAAVWFADEWQIKTHPLKDNNQYTCNFNLNELLQKQQSQITVFDNICSDSWTGTEIILIGVRRDISQERYQAITDDITHIYQRFIYGDNPQVIITSSYNGSPKTLSFTPFSPLTLRSPKHVKKGNTVTAVGPEHLWKVPVDFQYLGERIHGFIEIKETGSYINNPGLVMFRHDRVICGIPTKKYLPPRLFKTSNKHRALRVYGELNLDSSPVSYTKDRFTFDNDEFCDALIEATQGLNELLSQADAYRANINTPSSPTSTTPIHVPAPTQTPPPIQTPPTSSAVPVPTPGLTPYPSVTPYNPPAPTKIQRSSAVEIKLIELNSQKLCRIYHSLCTVSCAEHAVLVFVGAWSFFETMAKLLGASSNINFPDFFKNMMDKWQFNREDKKSAGSSLAKIHEEGNLNKHDSISFNTNAAQLVIHFQVLEKLIIRSVDEIIKVKCS